MKNDIYAYMRYELKHNKRILLMLCAILFILLPLNMLLINENFSNFYLISGYHTPPYYTFVKVSFIFALGLACITPLYQFRFLYKKQMADVYFSLPMKRSQFFFMQFMTGFIEVLLPFLFNYVITLLIVMFKVNNFAILIHNIPILILIIFTMMVQYTLITFVCIRCHHLFDGLIIAGMYAFVPLLIIGILELFFMHQTSMLLNLEARDTFAFLNVLEMLLSPSSYAKNLLINGYSDMFLVYNLKSLLITMYWLCVGLSLYRGASKYFVKYKIEDCEERTNDKFTYPLMITISVFLLILQAINIENQDGIIYMCLAFILYFGLLFFAQRKVKVTIKQCLVLVGLFVISYGTGVVFQATNGFGLVYEFPKVNTVEDVHLMISINETFKDENYPHSLEFDDEKDIEHMIEFQKEAKKHKEQTYEYNNQLYFYYNLKNGGQMMRMYNLNDLKDDAWLKQFIEDHSSYVFD